MDQAPCSSFGALLRTYREAAGLTQETLAERAALSVRGLKYLEGGARRPYAATVRRLATALALPAAERILFTAAAQRERGPARASPAPAGVPLVGRTRDLALMDRHLRGQGPPLLLRAGEPGIGKTRLLQEAVPRAAAAGWCVLQGGCQRRTGQEPYAPLLEALERYIHAQRPAHLRAALQECAWLVRLLPALVDGPISPLPAWTLTPAQERHLMEQALGRFLTNVAGPAGTLLVLDDLQWAGRDALDVLAMLLRTAVAAPVRVLGAYRDTEVEPVDPLGAVVADLAQAGRVSHQTLTPLTRPEAAALLDALAPPHADDGGVRRERMLSRASGVPFYLVSYAQTLVGEDGAESAAGDDVPWDLEQGIRQRVVALPPHAREVLAVAAAVGRVTSVRLLTDVVARSDDAVVAAVHAACRARLIADCGDGAYQFTHDVIREVVEADLGAARRAVVHRRIAVAMEERPDVSAVEVLAYHYARSDARERAVPYLAQAGAKARAQAALDTAAGSYRELVACLDGLGRPTEAAAARETLGTVLCEAAQFAAAIPVLEQAVQTYRQTGDVEGEARALAAMGSVYSEYGVPAEGVQRIRPLLERLEARGSSAGVLALSVALMQLLNLSGHHAEQLAIAERVAAHARAAGDDRLLVQAEWGRGLAFLAFGRSAEARQVYAALIPLAEGVNERWAVCYSWCLQGIVHEEWGELQQSRRCAEHALALAEQGGSPSALAYMLTRRGMHAYYTGDWPLARQYYVRAVALCRQIGPCAQAAAPLVDRGRLSVGEGKWAEATSDLEEALAILERSGDRGGQYLVHTLLAEHAVRRGHPAAALARLEPLRREPHDGSHVRRIALLTVLAWAYLAVGAVAQGAMAAQEAIGYARADGNRIGLVNALWVRGQVAAAARSWDAAQTALREALAVAHALPYPYGEARALQASGVWAAQSGIVAQGRAWLGAAREIFQRLGAQPDVEHVDRAIAGVPAGSRR